MTTDFWWPLTKGTTWTYTGYADYVQTVTGDTVIDGKPYANISSVSSTPGVQNSTCFAYWTGTQLFSRNYGGIIATSEICAIDITPNSTWSFDITANGLVNHYVFTNLEQGLTRTVLGQSYSDVIHVHLDQSFNFGGQTSTLSGEYYYSKGIGLIEATFLGGATIYLKSYSIK